MSNFFNLGGCSITLCTCNSDMNRKVCSKVLTVAECKTVWADSWASRDVK